MLVRLKQCNECKKDRITKDFSKHSGTKDRLQVVCKECAGKISRRFYKANHSRLLEVSRDNYSVKSWVAYEKKWGINKKDYEIMLTRQSNKCSLCSVESLKKLVPVVREGVLVTLICFKCNWSKRNVVKVLRGG